MTLLNEKKFWLGLTLVFFGVMTVMAGGRALFTEAGAAASGNIVSVILWFNFLSGFFYIIAGVSTFRMKSCVKRLSLALAVLNILALLYLLLHIFQGGLFENRTLAAMIFRTVFWISFAAYFIKSNFFKGIDCNC